jgi:transcriptional antiterminator RfaH
MSAHAIVDSPTDPMQPSSSQWIVVNTHPSRERYASEHLIRQGYEVYCPMGLRRIKHARRIQDVPRPLFPSYLFASVDLAEQQWRPILSTYGVRSVIRSGDAPQILDSRFVAALKAREVDGLVRRPESPFQVDQQVVFQEGPLHGLVGQILELREKDRIVVLMQMLNQTVKLRVHAYQLRPA